MTMSENIYSMTVVDLLDINKGDQPFLYMKSCMLSKPILACQVIHAQSYIL